jgi:hypothetical protein
MITVPISDHNLPKSAIHALIKRARKCFTIKIIPATFPGEEIILGFGKLSYPHLTPNQHLKG